MTTNRSPHILRSARLWIGAGLLVAILSSVFATLYVGGNLDPVGHLNDLPVALVNADSGAVVDGRAVNFGDQVVAAIQRTEQTNDSIAWEAVSAVKVRTLLGQGKVFGALEIPADLTQALSSLTSVDGSSVVRPTIDVLTNQAAGSLGSSFASTANQTAAHAASFAIGKQLLAAVERQGSHPDGATQLLLADPVTINVASGHALGSHSGNGLTAFYYALVLIVVGMLAANVVISQVDTALGYLHADFGPIRQRYPLRHTSRVHTLLIGIVLMLGLSIVAGSLVELMAVGVLGMDASHLALLWVFSVSAIAVVGISALTLLAAFGTPGMLVLTVVFVALAIPSSGGTVPIQALPGFFRWLAEFEPLRQVTGGIRSILYFNAQGSAGLDRAWTAMAIALPVALIWGFGVTHLYDRKGLHRVPQPDHGDVLEATRA
jgi:YhgE/Pip-like protein